MKLQAAQILRIRNSFQQMEEVNDFLRLLNEVKIFKYGENARPFTLRQIYRYVFPDNKVAHKRYLQFQIKKRSGKLRTIHAPVRGLKMIQTCLNVILQEVYQPHVAAVGFVPRKSIVDGARLHTGQAFVYNIDLKDFFPSIDQARVWARLQTPPFNLLKGTSRQKIANVIAGLCCHTIDATGRIEDGTIRFGVEDEKTGKTTCNVLPQGAPTSPTLTNIICERLDRKLAMLAKQHNMRYSRYADDITFSSDKYVYDEDRDFIKKLRSIIADQNFVINKDKTRLQTREFRQQVTGLTVNEQPNVPVRYIKQVRRWLYLWEKYGIVKAQAYFLKDYYDTGKGRGRSAAPHIGNVISGKLLYLKMVKGAGNNTYLQLQARLDILLQKDSAIQAAMNELKLNAKELKRQGIERNDRDFILSNAKRAMLEAAANGVLDVLEDSGKFVKLRAHGINSTPTNLDVKSPDAIVSINETQKLFHSPIEDMNIEHPLSSTNPTLSKILDILATQGIDDAVLAFNKTLKDRNADN